MQRKLSLKGSLIQSQYLMLFLAQAKLFWDRRSGCMVAIKKDDLALIVVYEVTNEKFRVVTAFKSSKLVILIRSKLSKGFWVKIQ